MATHDIYIYEDGKGKSSGITIPWLPESIDVDFGELRKLEYEILDYGPVEIPSGSNLGRIAFSSMFPGESRKGTLPFLRGTFSKPDTYTNKIDYWKENGTKLKILITGTTINHPVYASEFSYRHVGGFGDVEYDLTLKTRREVKILTVTDTSGSKNKPKDNSGSSDTTAYTIKSGDTLWGIAESKLGKGSRWKEIYNLNKEIIEETAKKRGKSNSNNGWWIFPGVVIKLPQK